MPRRLAGVCSLVVFAFSLVIGIRADNTFTTTVSRALLAMAATFAIGLVVGWIAQVMLDENLKAEEMKLKQQSEGALDDR